MKKLIMEFVGTFFVILTIAVTGKPVSNCMHVDGMGIYWRTRFWRPL